MKRMKNDTILDIVEKIKKGKLFPWLNQDHNKIKGMIISPDTDGFICALFLNNFFHWKTIGFYDGKILTIINNADFKNQKENFVFIDVEILRPKIKSIGHHILIYDNENLHPLIKTTEKSCIQPNSWRGMDVKNRFATKYPFGTFHLVLSVLYGLDPKNPIFNFDLKRSIVPSIYLDGVFKNLFNYPENCLDWLKYLSDGNSNHPFEKLLNHPTTPKDLMNLMKNFFSTLDETWTTQAKRSKGKIKLGKDIVNDYMQKDVSNELTQYLEYLAKEYNFTFNVALWPVLNNKLSLFNFDKKITAANKSEYNRILNQKPISLAITSKARNGLEYTLDTNKIFD